MTKLIRSTTALLLLALGAIGGSGARVVLGATPSVTIARAERPDAERPAPQQGTDVVATQARTRSPAPRHDDRASALDAVVIRLASAGLPHRDTGLETPAPIAIALSVPFDATAPPVLLTA